MARVGARVAANDSGTMLYCTRALYVLLHVHVSRHTAQPNKSTNWPGSPDYFVSSSFIANKTKQCHNTRCAACINVHHLQGTTFDSKSRESFPPYKLPPPRVRCTHKLQNVQRLVNLPAPPDEELAPELGRDLDFDVSTPAAYTKSIRRSIDMEHAEIID